MDHLQFLISNNILNFFSLTCYEAQSALDPVDQNLWRRMDFLSMWSHLHQKPPQFSRNGLVHIETWNLNLNPKSDEFQKRISKKKSLLWIKAGRRWYNKDCRSYTLSRCAYQPCKPRPSFMEIWSDFSVTSWCCWLNFDFNNIFWMLVPNANVKR